jgi:serine/threonine protein kinase
LTREAEIHRLCIDCPYITKLVEFYDFNSGPGSQQHLIMELMEGGDLMHDVLLRRKEMYMDQGPGTLWMTDAEVRVVTWRVLKALQFMHSLSPDGSSVLHRDLKPDNIMLALRGPDGCGDCASAKVADLGHAKELVGVSQTYTSSGIGTVEYMPPEIAAAIVHKREIGHNKALDMWTVGVLVFVCFMQEYPFGGTGDENNPLRPYMMEAVRKRVLGEGLQGTGPEALHGLFPPGSPKAALWEQRNQHGRELMQRLMQREPAERWRVEDALSSPWFAGIEEEQGAGSEQ